MHDTSKSNPCTFLNTKKSFHSKHWFFSRSNSTRHPSSRLPYRSLVQHRTSSAQPLPRYAQYFWPPFRNAQHGRGAKVFKIPTVRSREALTIVGKKYIYIYILILQLYMYYLIQVLYKSITFLRLGNICYLISEHLYPNFS